MIFLDQLTAKDEAIKKLLEEKNQILAEMSVSSSDSFPANKEMFKVNNNSTRRKCEICS